MAREKKKYVLNFLLGVLIGVILTTAIGLVLYKTVKVISGIGFSRILSKFPNFYPGRQAKENFLKPLDVRDDKIFVKFNHLKFELHRKERL